MADQIQTDEYLRDDLRVFVVPVDIFDVPDLSCHEQMLYIVLRSHCSARNLTAFPSYSTLAKEGRMSRDKAIQAMKKLIELGLVTKTEQYVANKHKKIVQTSNTYTIHTPHGGSRSQRLGGSSATTGVVVHNDQGSRSQRPKQNHLTDPSEQIHNNNTEHSVVVRDIETLIGVPLASIASLLEEWIGTYGEEYIRQKAEYIGASRDKWQNVIGAFRAAVLDNWKAEAAATKQKDDRYAEFYKLFPDS